MLLLLSGFSRTQRFEAARSHLEFLGSDLATFADKSVRATQYYEPYIMSRLGHLKAIKQPGEGQLEFAHS